LDQNKLSSDQNKAAARTLEILSVFASSGPARSAAGLARQLDITRNSAFRCLETLRHQGYLVKDPSGQRYELGPGITRLRSPRGESPDIHALCRPFMERLSEAANQSVHLLVHSGDRAVVVGSIQGLTDLFRLPIGTALPLHVSPGARAILAALPDDDVDAYIAGNFPLAEFAPGTITDPAQLRADIQCVRHEGWALSQEDFRIGRVGIAFPVLAVDGRPHGSMVVAGAWRSTTMAALLEMLPLFMGVMAEVNALSCLYHVQPRIGIFDD
jgi:DNA-binding IclR family transcriptional regulator